MTKDTARLVLVVEDDVSVRRPLVKFLEMHGFCREGGGVTEGPRTDVMLTARRP